MGRAPGLAQTCAATVSHRLDSCSNNSEPVGPHRIILDKLPNTPNRTAPPGLIARIVTGGLTGACVSLGGGQSAFVGAGLGLIGGIVGCFVGYQARARLVRSLRQPDFNVALLEDLVAIGGSLFIASRF